MRERCRAQVNLVNRRRNQMAAGLEGADAWFEMLKRFWWMYGRIKMKCNPTTVR